MIRSRLAAAVAAALLAALALPARAGSPCPPRDSGEWRGWQECNQACVAEFGLRGDPTGACEDRCDGSVPKYLPDVVAACAVCRLQKRAGDEAACVKQLLDDAQKRKK